jgi:hypothetical protein
VREKLWGMARVVRVEVEVAIVAGLNEGSVCSRPAMESIDGMGRDMWYVV